MKLLVTGATGMFGGTLVRQLSSLEHNHTIHALVRNKEKALNQGLDRLKNVQLIDGDLTKPETLVSALEGMDRIFLVAPMVPDLDQMEINLIKVAKQQGAKHIFKLYGAVKHENDLLIQLHNRSLKVLKESGLDWTLISPNSVMETSLLPFRESIKQENVIYGCTGHHKVGLIALNDVIRATAFLLLTPGHASQDYQLTGPEALSLYDIANLFSMHLRKPIQYKDMSEQEFENLLREFLGKTHEQIDMEVMCHMRAWNRDGADLVTDTYKKLVGEKPTRVVDWINQHIGLFA